MSLCIVRYVHVSELMRAYAAGRFLGGFLLAANNKLSGRPCVIGPEYNLRMDNRIALR